MLAPPPDPPTACPVASVSAMLCNSCMKQRETSGMYFAISFLRSALSRRAAAATKRRLICWQHAVMHFFTVSCNTPLSSPMYSATCDKRSERVSVAFSVRQICVYTTTKKWLTFRCAFEWNFCRYKRYKDAYFIRSCIEFIIRPSDTCIRYDGNHIVPPFE
jgi:hypothetical protein